MKTINAFIKRHPLLSFFALAFAISWGGILMVVGGPSGFPGTSEPSDPLFLFVMLAWLAGPSVAGILLTGLVYGKEGFRDLLIRMTRLAGRRSLVRRSAPYRPARVCGDIPCVLAKLP